MTLEKKIKKIDNLVDELDKEVQKICSNGDCEKSVKTPKKSKVKVSKTVKANN